MSPNWWRPNSEFGSWVLGSKIQPRAKADKTQLNYTYKPSQTANKTDVIFQVCFLPHFNQSAQSQSTTKTCTVHTVQVCSPENWLLLSTSYVF